MLIKEIFGIKFLEEATKKIVQPIIEAAIAIIGLLVADTAVLNIINFIWPARYYFYANFGHWWFTQISLIGIGILTAMLIKKHEYVWKVMAGALGVLCVWIVFQSNDYYQAPCQKWSKIIPIKEYYQLSIKCSDPVWVNTDKIKAPVLLKPIEFGSEETPPNLGNASWIQIESNDEKEPAYVLITQRPATKEELASVANQ